MSERKTPRKSPSKPRILNRWDDDLDKGLLLCVQYACSEAGLKIPWARVAEIMGPTFTEGGIVQHLAKLRVLMIGAGIPVPPSVKRGMVTKSPSKIYGTAANPRLNLPPVTPLFPNGTSSSKIKEEEVIEQPSSIYERARRATDKLMGVTGEDTSMNTPIKTEIDAVEPVKAQARVKPNRKGKGRNHGNNSDDEDSNMPDLYDSDSEYGSPKKRRRTQAKSRKSAVSEVSVDSAAMTSTPATTDSQADSIKIKIEEDDEAGPATRTRGVKRDYSQMAAPSSDEIEPDEEDQDEQERLISVADEYVVHDADGIDDDSAAEEDQEEEADQDIESQDDEDADDEHAVGAVQATNGNARATTYNQYPQASTVVDVPYGQLAVDPAMALAMAQRYNVANIGMPNFNGMDYMNNMNTFPNNHYGYSNIAMMNHMPQSMAFNSQLPSMPMFGASTQSSLYNSMPAGMNGGFGNVSSMSDDLTPFTFNSSNNNNGADFITEEDHTNSMPGGHVFLTQDDFNVDA